MQPKNGHDVPIATLQTPVVAALVPTRVVEGHLLLVALLGLRGRFLAHKICRL